MTEIEIGCLMRCGLPERAGTCERTGQMVAAWEADRNARARTVDWQLATADARVRLKHLYPRYSD